MKFAFISRHEPTAEQIKMAQSQEIELVHIGDTDAFSVTPGFVYEAGAFEGVVVVHPAAAMRLCSEFLVGVFENGSRAALDGKPEFFAKSFHIYDMRD